MQDALREGRDRGGLRPLRRHPGAAAGPLVRPPLSRALFAGPRSGGTFAVKRMDRSIMKQLAVFVLALAVVPVLIGMILLFL